MPEWKHQRVKPVIGVVGGIGAGKSMICRLFAQEGCGVIDSDRAAHEILQTGEVRQILQAWLGEGVFDPDGAVSRKLLGAKVFGDPEALKKLNGIVHPRVAARREEEMTRFMADGGVRAVVWDTPLLIEAGLAGECDAVVFVKVPLELRLRRVMERRGWSREELEKREKLQIPLDKKAELADYCIDNSGDEASSLRQVRQVLSQLSLTER